MITIIIQETPGITVEVSEPVAVVTSIAEKGDRGRPGEPGIQGPPGPPRQCSPVTGSYQATNTDDTLLIDASLVQGVVSLDPSPHDNQALTVRCIGPCGAVITSTTSMIEDEASVQIYDGESLDLVHFNNTWRIL